MLALSEFPKVPEVSADFSRQAGSQGCPGRFERCQERLEPSGAKRLKVVQMNHGFLSNQKSGV